MRATRRPPNRVLRPVGGPVLVVVLGWVLLTVVTAAYWFINARV
jgi:NaMN:DMB phosphoribosyltransferase